MSRSTIVSAFDAKTHLSRLLQEVENGQTITITRRGKPIARLTPLHDVGEEITREGIIAQFDAIRARVKGPVDIRKFIAQGRKY